MKYRSDILHHQSVSEWMSGWTKKHPQKTVYTLIDSSGNVVEAITFGELARAANDFALKLISENMTGERILIVLPSCLDYIVGFLGCLISGAVAVPFHPPVAERDVSKLKSIVRNARPKAFICNRSTMGRYEDVVASLTRDAGLTCYVGEDCLRNTLSDQTLITHHKNFSPGDIAFLQYTSGSTGDPKGVMVTHDNIVHNEYQIASAMEHDDQTVIVGWLPFFHDMGMIGNILQPLAVGGSSILMSPAAFTKRPRLWLKAISDYRATTSGGPNFAYDLCVHRLSDDDKQSLDLSSWRIAFNGAERIRHSSCEAFANKFASCGFDRQAFFPSYGLAESTLYVSAGPAGRAPDKMDLDAAALKRGEVCLKSDHNGEGETITCVSVAGDFFDQTVRIVDPESWHCKGENAIGEIWVKGRSVAKGYWNNAEKTAETFKAYTIDSGEGPFMRTGDLGFLSQGQLYVTGRLKELVIINGANIFPEDIEASIQAMAEDFRANGGVAFSLEDEKLVIVQSLRKEGLDEPGFAELARKMRQQVFIAFGLTPDAILFVKPSEIPKTSSGKLQRSLVKARYLDGTIKSSYCWKLKVASLSPDPTVKDINSPDSNRHLLADIQAWLKQYFRTRVNSFLIDERRTIPPHVVLDMGNKGLLGMQLPVEHGGLALSCTDFMSVIEFLGSKDLTIALFVGLSNILGNRPIHRFADQAIKARYLDKLATGRFLAAFALTEPGAGSNPNAIASTATETKDGSYVLSGTKYWSGSAAWSNVINVFARVIDLNGNSRGITAFAIPQDSEGLVQGEEALTMGMRGMIQNTIYLNDVKAQPWQIIGGIGKGMKVAQDAMCYGRLAIASACLGGMKRCYQLIMDYSKARHVSTGLLFHNPNTRHVLTEMAYNIKALQELIETCTAAMDQNATVSEEVLAAVKVNGTELLWSAVDQAMQLTGGRGFIESNGITQLMRDSRILRVFEGPTETLNHFIGATAKNNSAYLRSHLATWLPEDALEHYFDQVIARAEGQREQFPSKTFSHWAYIRLGEYVSELLLHSAGSREAQSTGGLAWHRSRMERSLDRLLVNLAAFDELASEESLEYLHGELNQTLDVWSQQYAFPKVERDEFLQSGVVQKVVAVTGSVQAPQSSPAPVLQASKTPQPEARAVVQRADIAPVVFLTKWLARRLTLDLSAIDESLEFAVMGLDSVDAVELGADIADQFGLEIDATALWNYPNIQELSRFITTSCFTQKDAG